jgi:YD repeat-containing protein
MENKQLTATNNSEISLSRIAAAERKSDLQTVSVRSIISILYRYKWLSLLIVVLISAATVAVVLLQPDKYSSRMKILVQNNRSQARLTPEDTKGWYSSQDVSEADINTEVALLTSRDLMQDLVRRAKLVEPNEGDLPETEKSAAERIDSAVVKLEKRLSVSPVKKSNIIEINYTGESPERAAAVLRELAALYLDKHLRLHGSTAGYDLFREQSERYEAQLKADESRLAAFEKNNNLVAIEEQKQTGLKSLADAEVSLSKTTAELGENEKRVTALQGQLARVSPRVLTQSRTIPNQDSVERLNTMIVELQNKRTQLLTKFRPDDRLVKEVDRQLETTRAAYDAASKRTAIEEATDLNPLRQKLETDLAIASTNATALRAPHQTYNNQVAQYRATLGDLENATRQHEALTRAVKQSEENYLLYARKSEEARITNAMDKEKISNVEIAEAATVSQTPSAPNRPMTLALGLFLAGFAGLCAAFGAEFMRNTIASPQELESLTGFPVLASMPKKRRRLIG